MLENPNQLFLWPREVLYVCNGNLNEFHEHYSLSLWIAFGGKFKYETESESGEYEAAILPPNVKHRLHAPDCQMAILQVDPDARDYRSLLQLTTDKIRPLEVEKYKPLFSVYSQLLKPSVNCAMGRHAFQKTLEITLSDSPQLENPLDSRIQTVLTQLKSDLPEDLSVDQLAKSVDLSSHRFMHLFKEQMGLPVRRYILWLRTNRAVRLLKEGLSLTDAAHSAGFADSAHMSRTFKEMIGIHPSFFFKDSRFVQAHFCDL